MRDAEDEIFIKICTRRTEQDKILLRNLGLDLFLMFEADE
jgi:hypothetical protein